MDETETGRVLDNLAREIHDDMSQRLAALAIQAGRLEGLLESQSGEAAEVLLSDQFLDSHCFRYRSLGLANQPQASLLLILHHGHRGR